YLKICSWMPLENLCIQGRPVVPKRGSLYLFPLPYPVSSLPGTSLISFCFLMLRSSLRITGLLRRRRRLFPRRKKPKVTVLCTFHLWAKYPCSKRISPLAYG